MKKSKKKINDPRKTISKHKGRFANAKMVVSNFDFAYGLLFGWLRQKASRKQNIERRNTGGNEKDSVLSAVVPTETVIKLERDITDFKMNRK